MRTLRAHGGGASGKQAYELISGDAADVGAGAGQGDNTVYDPTKYYNFFIGTNSRLDSLQAAVLNVKLEYLAGWNQARRRLSRRYTELLAAAGLADKLCPQAVLPQVEPACHLYVVKCEERDALAQYLGERGIASGIYYPVPLHLQKVYQTGTYNLGYRSGDLPVSEWLSRQTMALPLFPELTEAQQDAIVAAISQFYAERK